MTTHASTSVLQGRFSFGQDGIAKPAFRGGRFVRMPYQRTPNREKSIERRKRLAATQPLPPALAAKAKLTFSELAYARLLADDNLIAGDSRDCHDKMAARAGTCSRTIQRAQKRFKKFGWIEVDLRPNKGQKHDSNIVRIISPEWLTWIMMGPSPIARQKRRATENQLFSRTIEMLERRRNAVDKPVWIDPNLKAKLDQLEAAVKNKKIGAALAAPRSILLE
jgi:hypothetical protein